LNRPRSSPSIEGRRHCCQAERLVCIAVQAYVLNAKNWSLARRLDATHWR
jgi:hypothetical protein